MFHKRKRKKHFSNYIVAAAITAVALYTAAAVTLQFCGLAEISSTLTTCWFSFWTVEIVALAAIKGGKVKHGDNKTNDENKEDI
ncbi:MAG: hypothetical protein HDT47_02905 [Ruminococcaceae bacterium]|nr:hypothetical protein [Oscillospiraceae bacterium]